MPGINVAIEITPEAVRVIQWDIGIAVALGTCVGILVGALLVEGIKYLFRGRGNLTHINVLALLAMVVDASPFPGPGWHRELHIKPTMWDAVMHLTQGRDRFGGIPLVLDPTISVIAEVRIVLNRSHPGFLSRLRDWIGMDRKDTTKQGR